MNFFIISKNATTVEFVEETESLKAQVIPPPGGARSTASYRWTGWVWVKIGWNRKFWENLTHHLIKIRGTNTNSISRSRNKPIDCNMSGLGKHSEVDQLLIRPGNPLPDTGGPWNFQVKEERNWPTDRPPAGRSKRMEKGIKICPHAPAWLKRRPL